MQSNVPVSRDFSAILSDYAEKSRAIFLAVRPFYPHIKAAYYQPELNILLASLTDSSAYYHRIKQAAQTVSPGVSLVPELADNHQGEPWVMLKKADPLLWPVGWATGVADDGLKLPGLPSPLAATLAGGVIGGGLGYGGGWLAEKLMGDKVLKDKKLRRTLAIAGALGGAVPGALWGVESMRHNPNASGLSSWLDGWPFKKAQASHLLEGPMAKEAIDMAGAFTAGNLPSIPKNNFGQVVWSDSTTPLPVRAATNGVLEAASQLKGGTNWVTPLDIARIGAGMGSGYLSGLVVGQTLGALAGLSPQAQDKLKQTGVWAGILSNVVPTMFN